MMQHEEPRLGPDALFSSPAALRNRDAILDVLRVVLPPAAMVVEVASGSGEHVLHFAAALSRSIWQPSDPSAQARASISARLTAAAPPNILAPLDLDAAAEIWPIASADAVVAINMVHISPWEATLGLLRHAGRLLSKGGVLYLYGPYRMTGAPLAPSNAAFDADLRSRNPEWGIRRLDEVVWEAEKAGLQLDRTVPMPANNLSVVLIAS